MSERDGNSRLVFLPEASTLLWANYDYDLRIGRKPNGELSTKIVEHPLTTFASDTSDDGLLPGIAGRRTRHLHPLRPWHQVRANSHRQLPSHQASGSVCPASLTNSPFPRSLRLQTGPSTASKLPFGRFILARASPGSQTRSFAAFALESPAPLFVQTGPAASREWIA